MNQDNAETAKILCLYRKLSCALDLVSNEESDDGGDDSVASMVLKIRELSYELEQLLDNDDEGGRGADFDVASKVRVIEREISNVIAAVRTCVAKRDRGPSL